jgi:hypothetical protein
MPRTPKYVIIAVFGLLILGGIAIIANDRTNQSNSPTAVVGGSGDPCPDVLLTDFDQDQAMSEVFARTANTIADALQNATSTCFLTVTDVVMQSIPPEIGTLGNLRYLNLAHDGIEVLPPEIGRLTRLRIINLNDNDLSQIPNALFGLAELTDLALVRNKIDEVPSDIGRFRHLKTLHLDGNPIPSSTIEDIRRELPNTTVTF